MRLDLEIPEQPEQDEFSPLPVGWYPATIESQEETLTQAGDKSLLVTFRITNNGRTVRCWYNRWHSTSAEARDVAKKQLRSLGRACGLASIGDSAEIVNRTLEVKLELDGTWNKVVSYRRAQSAAPKPSSNGADVTKPKRPWEELDEDS